jgi:hypothetical protein
MRVRPAVAISKRHYYNRIQNGACNCPLQDGAPAECGHQAAQQKCKEQRSGCANNQPVKAAKQKAKRYWG